MYKMSGVRRYQSPAPLRGFFWREAPTCGVVNNYPCTATLPPSAKFHRRHFYDVWRQAGRFEGRSTVSTWLLAIARFKAISALRRRRDEGLDEEATAAIEDLSDDPATALEKKDKSAMLRKCLAGLSAEHREIIDLVYYHEKSVEEVAEIVGIPENTVKTRMFYARKRLAELLKSEGIERGWP